MGGGGTLPKSNLLPKGRYRAWFMSGDTRIGWSEVEYGGTLPKNNLSPKGRYRAWFMSGDIRIRWSEVEYGGTPYLHSGKGHVIIKVKSFSEVFP
jgi:hypothetical protein